MRALVTFQSLALAMLFASCAQVSVLGPNKDMIASADIEQIKRVVWQARYPRSAALFIRPLGTEAAAVQSGSAARRAGNYYTLIVRRRGGQWAVDPSTEVAYSVIPSEEIAQTASR